MKLLIEREQGAGPANDWRAAVISATATKVTITSFSKKSPSKSVYNCIRLVSVVDDNLLVSVLRYKIATST